MSTRLTRRVLLARVGTLALGAAGATALPALAAPVLVRFFGDEAATGPFTNVYLAVDPASSALSGLLASGTEIRGARVAGSVNGTTFSGSLFDSAGAQIGTIQGDVAEGSLTGSYSAPDYGNGTFSAVEAVADATRMRRMRGTYSYIDPELGRGVQITIGFDDRNGTSSGSGKALGKTVGRFKSNWIVDTQGSLWWMPTSFRVSNALDLPELPLFQPGVVIRLGLGGSSRRIQVLNPRGGEVLATLKKR